MAKTRIQPEHLNLDAKANIDSPTFTGSVQVPNATLSTEAVNKSQLDLKANAGIRITNAATTGTYNVDWNAGDVQLLTLTGATTIVDVNLPTGTATKVIEALITGSFGLTLPAYWVALPSSQAYDGAKLNHIVISCIRGTASSELVYYSNETTT